MLRYYAVSVRSVPEAASALSKGLLLRAFDTLRIPSFHEGKNTWKLQYIDLMTQAFRAFQALLNIYPSIEVSSKTI
jgi:hypothetical protein